MAVSITQYPTSPNVTGTRLLFDVTSSNINYPQYSYLMDVYESGSTDLITRVYQTPNKVGAAVFDPSRIVSSLVTTDDDILHITNFSITTNQFKTFDFKFGEAYGTSDSSSITNYPNQDSASLGLFNGTVDPNTGYNFPSQSYVPIDPGLPGPHPQPQFDRDAVLSDAPGYFTTSSWDNFLPINSNDHATISILKQPGWIFYDPFGPSVFGNNDIIFGGRRVGGYFKPVNMYGYISGSVIPTDLEEGIVHIPTGPQNIMSSSYVNITGSISEGLTPEEFFALDDWLYYYVQVLGVSSDYSDDLSTVEFYINERLVDQYSSIPAYAFPQRNYTPMYYPKAGERLRFVFANNYGALDYFNCYGPLKRNTGVDHTIASIPKVDYSTNNTVYSYSSKGETVYYTDLQDNYTITTPLLDQYVATWLEQLLESPNVFVVQNNELVPIILINSSYTVNTNENRQKVFTYTIEFKPAKGREITTDILECIPPVNP